MTARTIEVDDLTPIERRGSGVRVSDEMLLTYDVMVIAADVEGVVAAAGGWLCDRVRAGWQVTVLMPAGRDVRALTVLGVRADVWESVDTVRRLNPAALAVDASMLVHDDPLRREVLRTVDGGRTEVTVWGESGLFADDRRFGRVRHRLSAAARAFKESALLSPDAAGPEQAVEEFVSSALWYPPDGTDLLPVTAVRDSG